VGLEGGIDGLVHLSDLSWDEPGEEAVKQYSKGQEVDAQVLSIDPERERIALGIKQLNSDPFLEYVEQHPKGAVVTGQVTDVTPRQATVALADGIEGVLKVSELSRDRIEDMTTELSAGSEIEAAIASVDRRNRTINLSVKQIEMREQREALKSVQEQSEEAGPTTIGDLIKQQMEKRDS
jgi:small subunit ribosomal protein S1